MAKDRKKAEPGIEEQAAGPGEPGNAAADNNLVNTVWNFLSSMKLGIILLLVLAVASIIGTIWVPKDPFTGQPDYLKFYNNPLFNILLGLLALNLLVCSLNRLKGVVNTLKGPKPDFSENFVKNLKSGASLKLKTPPEQAAERVMALLKKRGYRVFSKQEEDSFKISSDKGHLGIFGPYLSHLSFFIIILAMMIKFSGLIGFDGTFAGWEGETYSLGQVQGIDNVDPEDYFDIRVNNFRTEYRPDGKEIKQWFSDMTVIDGGNTFDFTIFVNQPLVYKGIKFYQSSFGHQFSGKVTGPEASDQQFNIGMQDYIQPPGTQLFFVPMGFEDAANAVKLLIYKGQQLVYDGQATVNTPFKYEDSEVTFEGVRSYTVLSTKKDPGVPIIGAGSILLMVAIVISFIFRQRRVWSAVLPEKDGSLVQIGGISVKDKRGLDSDIDDIISELKN